MSPELKQSVEITHELSLTSTVPAHFLFIFKTFISKKHHVLIKYAFFPVTAYFWKLPWEQLYRKINQFDKYFLTSKTADIFESWYRPENWLISFPFLFDIVKQQIACQEYLACDSCDIAIQIFSLNFIFRWSGKRH